MKIAFVGKGGSGKSTLSWIFAKYLASINTSVLAIDADHNMDLTSLLGIDVTEKTPTMSRSHEAFRQAVGLKEDREWPRIVLEARALPRFTLNPADPFTASVAIPLQHNLSLIIVGLGTEDILYSDRCAHGHSAPLKYYLPLFDGNGHEVIIDSVAGTDMLNFGLYAGADMIIVSVESHRNSIKVAEQITDIAKKIGVPIYFILNKPQPTPYLASFTAKYDPLIIGQIPLDPAINAYDFNAIAPETIEAIRDIWKKITANNPAKETLSRLKSFERMKNKIK